MSFLSLLLILLFAAGLVALIFIRVCTARPKEISNYYSSSRFTPLEVDEYKLKKREVIPNAKGPKLSETSRSELHSKLLSLASSKFRASACAIISSEEPSEIHVTGAEGKIRLLALLKHFYKPFFVLGSQDSFGFQETAHLDGPISQFNAIGFRYIISHPILDEDSKLVLWLGYHSPPDSSLIGGFKSFVIELEREMPSLKHFYGLSERIEAAESANRLKSEALAHVSHDIRSPLNNIRSILSLLKQEIGPSDLVDVALQNCESVSDIVESMLDYSLHQAGKLVARSEVLDIRALILDVVESYKIASKMKGLAIKCNTEKDSPLFIRGDKRHIKRILTNLVSNAVKYTKYGHIDISCDADKDEMVVVSVKDTGIGMSDGELKQLFVPFTRFETKGIEGIGLGLALSQVLASLNGGLISVTSQSGKGSTFLLYLVKAEKNLISTARQVEKSYIKRKVLIVDDDKDCVFTLSKSLEGEGFDVLSSVTISDAISILNFEKPDAIITDASMPDGGGLKLLKFVSQMNLHLPVAVLTGHEGNVADKLKANGAAAIFTKPTNVSELVGWINSVADGASDTRALVA